MPAYSFGVDSPVKVNVSDKTARLYNQAADRFFKAQVRFTQKFGRKWNPETDVIKVGWSRKEKKAWNVLARLLDEAIKSQGPFHPNDFIDDFLVKNVVSAVAVTSDKWGRAITIAAACGALYGLLRGL